jgi:hypothetical protein
MALNDMGHAVDEHGKRVGGLCWNCPIAILVYLDDQPCYGLGVEFRGKALCIRQMQGVQGNPPLTDLRDWPELLVQACIRCAERAGLKEVRIYKADQDIGYYYPANDRKEGQTYEEFVKAHQDRMRRRYDRVAQKMKFKKQKKYYSREIPH